MKSEKSKTIKLFWTDPYLCQLETTVSQVISDTEIALNETIFFAFSGGQESDSGSIAGIKVEEAQKVDEDIIIYRFGVKHHLNVGDKVKVEIEWERRYRLMKLHFAAEIVLEIIYTLCPGIEKIGAHIAADKARIDFKWTTNISSLLPQVQKRLDDIVHDDSPITSGFSDEIQERRYWEISGIGKVPCGGTHLKKTSEIGKIMLKRDNVGKGKERIIIRFLS